jgi:hypothetical protein
MPGMPIFGAANLRSANCPKKATRLMLITPTTAKRTVSFPEAEIERLLAVAKNRHGHRNAAMVLMA